MLLEEANSPSRKVRLKTVELAKSLSVEPLKNKLRNYSPTYIKRRSARIRITNITLGTNQLCLVTAITMGMKGKITILQTWAIEKLNWVGQSLTMQYERSSPL